MQDKPKKRHRMVPVTDPKEIEAIERADWTDPVGGKVGGQWFAESATLAKYRKIQAMPAKPAPVEEVKIIDGRRYVAMDVRHI